MSIRRDRNCDVNPQPATVHLPTRVATMSFDVGGILVEQNEWRYSRSDPYAFRRKVTLVIAAAFHSRLRHLWGKLRNVRPYVKAVVSTVLPPCRCDFRRTCYEVVPVTVWRHGVGPVTCRNWAWRENSADTRLWTYYPNKTDLAAMVDRIKVELFVKNVGDMRIC